MRNKRTVSHYEPYLLFTWKGEAWIDCDRFVRIKFAVNKGHEMEIDAFKN